MGSNSMFTGRAPGAKITLEPDWFVLNDGAAAEVPPLLRDGPRVPPEKVKVFIDHETPCGSEAVAAKQKALIRFADRYGCELFNGYGVSYQLMLDKFVRPGQMVTHCGDFGSIYGSVGALSVRLTPDEMAAALESGEVAYTVPEMISLELTGSLRAPADGKDAALAFLARGNDLSGKLLTVGGSGLSGMTASQKTAFFQMLSAGGCLSALEGAAEHPALALDLDTVVPLVSPAGKWGEAVPAGAADMAVTSVFVGGCSSGRIEDIRKAAALIRGRHVSRNVRLTVAFATTEVYIQAANEGLLDILMDGGAIVMNQGCSACYAHSQGLADGRDIVLSAGSRSCPNCNGEGDAKTYLCSVSTAIASAVAGHVCPAMA